MPLLDFLKLTSAAEGERTRAAGGGGGGGGGEAPASNDDPHYGKILAHFDSANTSVTSNQNQSFADESDSSHTITTNGDPLSHTFNPYYPPVGYRSSQFDGTGDYLTVTGSSDLALGTGDFTIEFFLKSRVVPTSSDYDCVFANPGGIQLFYVNGKLRYNHALTAALLDTTSSVVADRWTHYALVRESGTTKWYVDGTAEGSYSDSKNWTNTSNWYIGSYDGTQQYFNGWISNLRVVKGTAVYTSDFTPSTTPLTDITNTSLLACQSAILEDTSSKDTTITASGNASVSSHYPNNFQLSTAHSTSTHGHSILYDNAGDYHTVANHTDFEVAHTDDFTIEMWVYLQTNTSNFLTGNYTNGSPYNGFALAVGRTGQPAGQLEMWTGTSWIDVQNGLAAGHWYHIAVSNSSGTLYFWVNGKAATGTATATAPSTILNTTTALGIGENGAAVGQPTDGYIADYRFINGTAVYTSAFSPPTSRLSKITNTKLMLQPIVGFVEKTGKRFEYTYNGNIEVSNLGKHLQYGSTFDGSGDWIQAPSGAYKEFGNNDFTCEAWVQPADTSRNYIFTAGQSTATHYNFAFEIGSKLQVYLSSTGSSWDLINADPGGNGIGSTTIIAGRLYHVAFVRNGTNFSSYLNGVQQISVSIGTSSVVSQSSENLNIGKSAYLGSFGNFNGKIWEARVVNGTAVYTSAFTPPRSPLTAITNTGLLLSTSSSTVTDTSTNSHTLTLNGDLTSTRDINLKETKTFNIDSTLTSFGNPDYIIVKDDHKLLNLDDDDFTIEFWFKRNKVGDATYADSFICNVTGIAAIGLGINPSGYTGVSYQNTVSGSWTKVGADPGHTFGSIQCDLGKWYHYAVVRDGSNGYQYVNGVRAETFTFTGTLSDWGSTGMYFFHWHDGYARNFNGEIFDFRMTKGVARYTAPVFNVPTSKLPTNYGTAAAAQASTLATDAYFANTMFLQSANTLPANTSVNNNRTTIDHSTTGSTVTLYNNTFIKATNPYIPVGEWSADMTPSFGYYYWTNASAAIPPQVAWLDGASDSGTFECWVYLNQAQPAANYVYTHASLFQVGQVYLNFGVLNTGYLRYFYTLGYPSQDYFDSTTALNLHQWHHVALVRDGTDLKMYIDGVLSGTKSSYAGTSWASGSSGQTLYHGYGGNTQETNYFKGYISNMRSSDNVRYTGTFTPPTSAFTDDANTLYLFADKNNLRKTRDSNAYTILRGNSPRTTPFSPYESGHFTPNVGSVNFDGTTDYLTVAGGSHFDCGTGDSTFEGWYYPYVEGGASAFWFGNFPTGGNFQFVQISSPNYVWYMGHGLGVTPYDFEAFNWYHIAGVRNGNTVTIYINGEAYTSGTVTGSVGGSNFPVYMGERNDGYYDINGMMSDCHFYKGYAKYTSNFTPPTSPIPAHNNTVMSLPFKDYAYYDQTASDVYMLSSDKTKANAWPWGRHIKYASLHPNVTNGRYYIAETAANEMTFGTGDVTVELFFMPIGNPSYQQYNDAAIFTTSVDADTHGLAIMQSDNTGIQFLVGAGTGSWPVNQTYASKLTFGRWHHIVYCRQGNVHRGWCNGELLMEVTNSVSATCNNNRAAVGGRSSAGNQHCYGYIGDVRVVKGTAIYTTQKITPPFEALTAVTNTVFLQSTNSTTLVDTSASPLTITQEAGIGTYTNFKENLQVATTPLSFDGGSYIDIEEGNDIVGAFGTQDFTIEAYVFRQGTGIYGSWLASDHTGFNSGAIFFRFGSGSASPSGNNNGKFHVGWHGVGDSFIQTTNTYADRTWHHYALVRSGNSFTQYVNGLRDGTATSSANFNLNVSNGIRLGQSSWDGSNGYFNGMISQLRITVGNARYSGPGFVIPDNYFPAKKP